MSVALSIAPPDDKVTGDAMTDHDDEARHAAHRPRRALVRRLGSYGAVSVVVVLVSQGTLAALVGLAGWRAAPASVASTLIGTVVAYLLYRRYVWKGLGDIDRRHTITLFAVVNIIGLVVSTIAVSAAEALAMRLFDHGLLQTLAINVASIGSYAAIWVARFIAFDRLHRRPARG